MAYKHVSQHCDGCNQYKLHIVKVGNHKETLSAKCETCGRRSEYIGVTMPHLSLQTRAALARMHAFSIFGKY